MNDDSLLAGLKVISAAILFAVCGACSAHWLLPDLSLIFPLPFALVCTLLFMQKARAVFAIALMDIVWLISSFAASLAGAGHSSPYGPGLVGGLIGGVGLVLCVVICHPSAFSFTRIAIGAFIGAIAGLAFASWTQIQMVQHHGDNINRVFPKSEPIGAFAIWQAAMGTYLYVISRVSARERVMEIERASD